MSILLSKYTSYWGGYAEARSMVEVPHNPLYEIRKKRLKLMKSI